VLAGKFDVPFLWTLPVAGIMAAVLGVTLGAIVFRVRSVRGELFALLTLAVTFVLATIVLNTPIDGGPGVYLSAVAVPTLAPTPSGTFYVLALGLAVATLMIARSIAQARLGLGSRFTTIEDAAEVMCRHIVASRLRRVVRARRHCGRHPCAVHRVRTPAACSTSWCR
jgi:branched-chain amino acid transport system permease protein